MGVVDVAGEEHTGMHLAPVTTHLLAVFTACVEIGNLIGTEHIVQTKYERRMTDDEDNAA